MDLAAPPGSTPSARPYPSSGFNPVVVTPAQRATGIKYLSTEEAEVLGRPQLAAMKARIRQQREQGLAKGRAVKQGPGRGAEKEGGSGKNGKAGA